MGCDVLHLGRDTEIKIANARLLSWPPNSVFLMPLMLYPPGIEGMTGGTLIGG
jgi:hypothetical protein